MRKILFFILVLVGIVACDKDVDGILSHGKMEDVLYDYHLAQGMLEQLPAEEREKMNQAYIDAVFEKHGITEADFDSSLVWYNRHAKKLNDIYKNIQERLENENQRLALTTGETEMMTVFSASGDTANIWNAPTVTILRSKEGINYESFIIPADSTFHRKDKFVLVCNPLMIKENNDDRESFINIGFTVTYADGKTQGTSTRSNASRNLQLTINATEDKDISSVSGYFYYSSQENFRNIAIITGLGLVRMRTVIEESVEKADSLQSDSINKDLVPDLPHEHLSPEKMREQNQSDSRIQIKAAPDVRTPNSYGPRRRTARPKKQ